MYHNTFVVLIISIISLDYPRRHIIIYNLWFLNLSISSFATVHEVIFFSTSPSIATPWSVLTLLKATYAIGSSNILGPTSITAASRERL